jgi:hypothetical protein
MVLAELGKSITSALQKLNKAAVIDEQIVKCNKAYLNKTIAST